MSEKTIEVMDTSLLVGTPPPDADAQLREIIYEYVMTETHPEHHGLMRYLWQRWHEWNEEFFGGLMTVAILLINEPSNPRRLGDCGPESGFGCSSQIRIRPSLLTGTHPIMSRGSHDPEGQRRFVEDVLLHEMIHQWQQEITHERDSEDKGLPKPSYWPAVVRPDDYYLGAVLEKSSCVSTSKDEGKKSVSVPLHDLDRAAAILQKHLSLGDIGELCRRLKGGAA